MHYACFVCYSGFSCKMRGIFPIESKEGDVISFYFYSISFQWVRSWKYTIELFKRNVKLRRDKSLNL